MNKEDLIEKIRKTYASDDVAFVSLINTIIDEGFITEKEIANKLSVSDSTVKQWRMGINLPNKWLRPLLYKSTIAYLSSKK